LSIRGVSTKLDAAKHSRSLRRILEEIPLVGCLGCERLIPAPAHWEGRLQSAR
jgi:hypothetical protein